LELARNQNIHYKLGWHVLRNRTPAEKNNTSEERKRVEKEFFAAPSNWAPLGPDHLGIDTLRTKLSKELVKHVMVEMPKVQAEIRAKLEEVRRALEKLGNRKDTPEEMRDELRELCEKSQALTRSAMEGQYIDLYGPAFFHPSPQTSAEALRKLRARIVLQNERFAEDMAKFGHLVEIIDESPGTPGAPPPEVNSEHPQRMSRNEFIRTHVEPLLDASPGLELRMDRNPLLVYTLFRSYSEHWPTIAQRHIEEIQAICADFLQEIVDFAWPEDMRQRAWQAFVETRMEDRLQAAYKEAGFLFKDRTRAAKPYDPEHTKKVMEWIAERNQRQAGGGFLSEFAPDAFLQKMLVYYELTRKTFISNVIVQVVERHLIDELDRIFNVTRVVELDDAAVIEIASEDEYSRQQRLELRNTRRTLEAGERICRKYMARRDLKLVSTEDASCNLNVKLITKQDTPPQATRLSSTTARPLPGRRRFAERTESTATLQPTANFQPTVTEEQQPTPVRSSGEVKTSPTSNRHSADRHTSRNYTPTSVQDPWQQTNGTIPTEQPQQYNQPTYPNSQYSAVPNNGRYDPYEAAPNIPPRPAAVPPLPPKRQGDNESVRDDASSDHRANRQGNFLGKFKRQQ
jgi:hypothetical protein